ncbi:hypothetical protein GUJ93_ZPchr0012g21542 [Zizania palustris]|uniref:SHSP domain-containing protein n=1 Tax=Zizania palustris TaxID=103762 RepID=A0A8J5WUH5_ZIZPA|nr:hypothetical protein GUJ93_ZPchr0012g21542 [Zizania palustris]
MSTVVASFAPVSRSPAVQGSSGARVRHYWKPPASGPFPASAAVKCRRPLPMTRALPEKHRPAFSIPPTVLLYPVPPPDSKERWDIKEEESYVRLWFQVPGLSEDDLEITAGEDVLEIKRKVHGAADGEDTPPEDVHGVGSFHVRLLMTKEYDSNNVRAELKAGMLEVTVGKSTGRRATKIRLGPQGPAQIPSSTEPSKDRSGKGLNQIFEPNKGPVGPGPKSGLNQTQGVGATSSTGLNKAQGGGGTQTAGPKETQSPDGGNRNAKAD